MFLNKENSADQSAHIVAIFLDKMMKKENQLSENKTLMKEIKSMRPETIVSVFR